MGDTHLVLHTKVSLVVMETIPSLRNTQYSALLKYKPDDVIRVFSAWGEESERRGRWPGSKGLTRKYNIKLLCGKRRVQCSWSLIQTQKKSGYSNLWFITSFDHFFWPFMLNEYPDFLAHSKLTAVTLWGPLRPSDITWSSLAVCSAVMEL